jgi:hypothetical protein
MTAVTFTSPCVEQGRATLGAQPVNTASGLATTTYTAAGCNGPDQISATATVDGTALAATGNITVALAAVGRIVFESADPTNIALSGTGVPGNPETSTVVFRVLDAAGSPRPGANVTFGLNTTVGGLSLTSTSGVSGNDGTVSAIVQGGTVATTVRVTATITGSNPAIATQSNQLTVTTGIPDQDSFSLAVACPNVEAWNYDGEQTTLTARLADRFNNPVPDGTAITFITEGGRIESRCETGTTATEGGVCTVTWTGSNPQTPNGRSAILATAIGEESFVDLNGNGSFDVGETFADLGERYLDVDESNTYTAGLDPIYDFNQNGSRDAADGFFNGVLCNDQARCSTARTTGIGASNQIIMSDGAAIADIPSGTTLTPNVGGPNASQVYTIVLSDLNGNPLPAETEVEASLIGTGYTLATGSSNQSVACSFDPTEHEFRVNTGATPAASATLIVTVTSPRGIQRSFTYTINQ